MSSYERFPNEKFDAQKQSAGSNRAYHASMSNDSQLGYDSHSSYVHHSFEELQHEHNSESISKCTSEFVIQHFTVPKDELPLDIDKDDIHNELQCTEYVDSIYSYLRVLEASNRPVPNYILKQQFINVRHRDMSVDYIVQLHRHISIIFEYSLELETLFLSVSLVDRFLSRRMVSQEKIRLVAVTCFYIACKFEEKYYPTIDELLRFVPSAGSKEDVCLMERTILNELKYLLGIPTSVTFLKRFIKAAFADTVLGMTARFISEFCLMSISLCTNYLPSVVAAATVANSLRVVGKAPWTATLEKVTGYTYEQIRPCMVEMREHVKRAPTMKLQTIYKKYSVEKYRKAAIRVLQNI
ncbi:putative G2/mitotic-specific cyclin-2 [Monocercomonoides exilis]|uniref:putative G2/mitotic-specific cyclin-2 n=1 Tax=Monocercomonoides exilis TaxID=2049356 RepID=UPI00355A9E89|nr:putative G2/mitotic-specific cyclin-2 [Monocercomonoides exilis]